MATSTTRPECHQPHGRIHLPVDVVLPVGGDASGGTGHGLVERALGGRAHGRPEEAGLRGVVPEPVLTGLEARDHRVAGGAEVCRGVLGGRACRSSRCGRTACSGAGAPTSRRPRRTRRSRCRSGGRWDRLQLARSWSDTSVACGKLLNGWRSQGVCLARRPARRHTGLSCERRQRSEVRAMWARSAQELLARGTRLPWCPRPTTSASRSATPCPAGARDRTRAGDADRPLRHARAARHRPRRGAVRRPLQPRRRGAVDLPADRPAGRRARDDGADRPDARCRRTWSPSPWCRRASRRRASRRTPASTRHRPGRDRRRPLREDAPAHPRRDRGDPPEHAARVRRPRLPPVRVEVRQPQRAVATRRRPAGLHLRGPLPPPHGDQGPQPRHRLVLGHRRRVARGQGGPRALARPGQLRRPGRQLTRSAPASARPGDRT